MPSNVQKRGERFLTADRGDVGLTADLPSPDVAGLRRLSESHAVFPPERRTRPRADHLPRRGAAVVEFAVVVPVLLAFVLGMIEIGRAIMVSQVLAHAARSGARLGTLETSTTEAVGNDVRQRLADAGVHGATVAVLVGGGAGEVKGATTGTEVAVQIAVPYANVSWLSGSRYLTGKSLSGRCAMRHE